MLPIKAEGNEWAGVGELNTELSADPDMLDVMSCCGGDDTAGVMSTALADWAEAIWNPVGWVFIFATGVDG